MTAPAADLRFIIFTGRAGLGPPRNVKPWQAPRERQVAEAWANVRLAISRSPPPGRKPASWTKAWEAGQAGPGGCEACEAAARPDPSDPRI